MEVDSCLCLVTSECLDLWWWREVVVEEVVVVEDPESLCVWIPLSYILC